MPDAPGPQGLQAGQLNVPVVADTRGFAAKLRSAVESAATGLKAVVDVAISEASLTRARGEIETAMSGIEAEVHIRVDEDRARNYLRGVVGRVADDLTAKVRLDADTSKLDREARTFAADSEGTIHVGADTKAALAEAEATRARIDAKRADIDVGVDRARLREGLNGAGLDVQRQMMELTQRLREGAKEVGFFRQAQQNAFANTNLLRFIRDMGRFALVTGVVTGLVSVLEGLGSALVGLVGGLSAVVGGLYAITAATGPAIAGLAVIPNLIAAAAQAGAALLASFSGVGGAVGAILNQRKQVAGATADTARQEEQAARRVADARRSVSDAVRNGARQIESAERSLVNAQEQSRFAQERLNDARRDAKERLEDLNLELKQAALDEESASIGLERAKERLAETQSNPFATELDKREANLAYQQALQRVDEVAERNDDLAREGGELRARGVEGSEQVVAAKQAIVDAARAEQDAERALADAREQSARSIADAERNLADAMRDAADGSTAAASAANQVEQALADLSPEAKSFAYFLADELIPRLKELRNEVAAELLPTIEDGLRRLMTTLLPTITTELVETARGAAEWFERLFSWLASPEFNADFSFISDGNQRALKNFGDATLALLQVLTDIMVVVAQPGGLLDRFSLWVKTVSEGWAATTSLNRSNKSMFKFFDRGADVIGQWGDILGNIWTGLLNIGSAGSDAGQDLLDSFEGATERFIEWTEENEGALKDWFAAIVPITESVGRTIIKIVRFFGRLADDPNTKKMVDALEKTVGPAIARFLQALQDSDAGDAFARLLVTIADTLTAIIEAGGFQQFMETLTGLLDGLRRFAENNPQIIKWFSDLAGTVGGWGILVGPLLLFASGLGRLLRPIRGLIGLLARGAEFLGVGGKGKAGKFGRGGLVAGLLAALIGTTGVAGGGVDGISTLLTAGGLGYLGVKGGQKLFGRGAASQAGKNFLSRGAARGSAAAGLSLIDRQVAAAFGAQAPAAAAGAAARQGGGLSRFLRSKGGRVTILAGGAALIASLFGGGRADAAPAGSGYNDLFYDPENGIYVDPATGVAFDSSGGLLSYPSATPPPGAPGLDGLGLALGGGTLAYAARSAYKKPGGVGFTPRAGLNLTRAGASTGIRNAIKAFGPKAFKVGAGPIGVASLGVDFLGSAIDSGRADFRGNAASVLKGAGGGAAAGALVGSVVPVIGTALGAAAGAVIGGLVGWLKRPNEQLLAMKDNAVGVAENIYQWWNAGRGGEVPDLAFRNVAKTLADVGREAFEAARDQGTYSEALGKADEAMRRQYDIIKGTLMEGYGLTEDQVEDLIGAYDEYNAKEVLPKHLSAEDSVSPALEQAGRNLAAYAEKNPPPKTLTADDEVSPGLDQIGRNLAAYAEKNPPPKTLAARDRVSGTAERVLEKLRELDAADVRPKLVKAVDRTAGPFQAIRARFDNWNQYRIPEKVLSFRTNVGDVASYIYRVLASIPSTIPVNIAMGIAQRGANLTAQAQAYASGRQPYGMATGGTVYPRPGGTLVRLAEAGRPETVVDTGTVNQMLAELTDLLKKQQPGGPRVLVTEGAIQQTVYNPVPEKASVSLSRRMRQAAEFGLAGAAG